MNFKTQRLLFKWILLWSSLVIGMEKLPLELIQKVGQHLFVMELNNPEVTDFEGILKKHCNLFDRGGCWVDSFAISSKTMQRSLNNPVYNKQLEHLWYRTRTLIPHFPYGMQLLKHVIGERDPTCVNHQREVLGIVSNFFAHEEFFPVMFQYHKKKQGERLLPLFDGTFKSRGSYGYTYHGCSGQHLVRKELLCDWPFLFVTFYSSMLPYYKQADSVTRERIKYFISQCTPFGNNPHFTLDWFWAEFIGKSVSLLKSDFSQNNTDNDISTSQLISFINCYSQVNTDADNGLSFSCFGDKQVWDKLDEKQKILVFYYRNALCLNLMLLTNSSVYVQDCLYLIEKWLKREYQDENLVIIDDTVTFPLRNWNGIIKWLNFFKVLPFLFLEIKKNNIPEHSFFEVLKIVLTPHYERWVTIVMQKMAQDLSKEEFLGELVHELLQLTQSYHPWQKSEIPDQIIIKNDQGDVEFEQKQPIDNASDQLVPPEKLTITDEHMSANSADDDTDCVGYLNDIFDGRYDAQDHNSDSIIKSLIALESTSKKDPEQNPVLNNGKKPDSEKRIRLLKKIIFFSVASALTCFTLYVLFYTLCHQRII